MSAIQQVLFGYGYNNGTILLSSIAPSADALSYNNGTSSATVNLQLISNNLSANAEANGTYSDSNATGIDSYAWLINGTASLYSVRLDVTGSTFDSGSSSINTWIPITSNIVWALSAYSNQNQRSTNKNTSGTLSFVLNSNLSNVLGSTTVSFHARARTQTGPIP